MLLRLLPNKNSYPALHQKKFAPPTFCGQIISLFLYFLFNYYRNEQSMLNDTFSIVSIIADNLWHSQNNEPSSQSFYPFRADELNESQVQLIHQNLTIDYNNASLP